MTLTQSQYLEWASTRHAFACKIITLEDSTCVIADQLYRGPVVVKSFKDIIEYLTAKRVEHAQWMESNRKRVEDKRKEVNIGGVKIKLDLDL